MVPSIDKNKIYSYSEDQIRERETPSHQTHNSKILSAIYRASNFLTKPVAHGVHDILVLQRKGTGHGAELGPGGESKRYKYVTATAWIALSLLTLPLVILGIIGKHFCRPGQGKDKLVFMNAAANGYKPPVLNEQEEIRIATYNVAWLPSPVDAIKDVYASEERAAETATWIRELPENELPLFIGLQEAFDPEASRALTDGIKDLYPYAVTNAGWVDYPPILGSNSGLQFHSRVPIKSAVFCPFQDLQGFGVKCSDRGVLRVEVDLGNGKRAMVYVTHLQAHAEYENVRENELRAIKQLMDEDKATYGDCDGHYYLMGDLNVSNVDDESLERIDEHERFNQNGGPLAPFYDPYLSEHEEHGEGTFYKGADQPDREENGYGTKTFYDGPGEAVNDCRYDYVLKLATGHDKGYVDFLNVKSEKFPTCPLSDHKMVCATFKKEV
jgi:hypothetical protein